MSGGRGRLTEKVAIVVAGLFVPNEPGGESVEEASEILQLVVSALWSGEGVWISDWGSERVGEVCPEHSPPHSTSSSRFSHLRPPP